MSGFSALCAELGAQPTPRSFALPAYTPALLRPCCRRAAWAPWQQSCLRPCTVLAALLRRGHCTACCCRCRRQVATSSAHCFVWRQRSRRRQQQAAWRPSQQAARLLLWSRCLTSSWVSCLRRPRMRMAPRMRSCGCSTQTGGQAATAQRLMAQRQCIGRRARCCGGLRSLRQHTTCATSCSRWGWRDGSKCRARLLAVFCLTSVAWLAISCKVTHVQVTGQGHVKQLQIIGQL